MGKISFLYFFTIRSDSYGKTLSLQDRAKLSSNRMENPLTLSAGEKNQEPKT